MTAVRPGPASVRGLRLLAEVGPMPIEVWGLTMGWGQSAGYSHAKRLEAAGWLARCYRVRGEGSLVYATRSGTKFANVDAVPVLRDPAPHTWPHHEACAWMVAWLKGRGRTIAGSRGLLSRNTWNGTVTWRERGEVRRRGHRPDLGGQLPKGTWMPIEVELTEKSTRRLNAVLQLHADWIRTGQSPAVFYVCATERLGERVLDAGARAGLFPDRGVLRVESLDWIRESTLEAREASLVKGWYPLRRSHQATGSEHAAATTG